MRRQYAVLLAVAPLLLAPARALESGTAAKDPSAYGLPARLRSLSQSQYVGATSRLTPVQKTEALVYWLAKERIDPMVELPSDGLDRNSDYALVQIIWSLAEWADAATLNTLSHDVDMDHWMRDAVRIGLGMKGDAEQIPTLIRVLKTSKSGELRSLVTDALGRCGAMQAIPLLEKIAREDPYLRKYSGCLEPPETLGVQSDGTYYAVRHMARQSLRSLRSRELRAYSEQWNRPFLVGLKEHRAKPEAERKIVIAPWVMAALTQEAMKPPTSPKSTTPSK